MPSRYDPPLAPLVAALVSAAAAARRVEGAGDDLARELEGRARRLSVQRANALTPRKRYDGRSTVAA